MKKNWFLSLTILCFFSLSWLSAQNTGNDLKPVTGTYVLTNVKIVQQPGKVIEIGNVIIKDGLIGPVGTRIAIPEDAKIIKGDSMYVYPGFIAGISHIGVPKPEASTERGRPDVKDPGNPGNKLAGIQPEQQVVDVLKASDKSVADMRKLGFTAAHVVPRGKMLPGSGAVILLNGDQANQMIIKDQSALFAQLAGARRVYPATVIAVMSKFRELYKQAEQAKAHEKAYANDPSGMQRPNYDRSLQAFYPSIEGDMPIFFKAPDVKSAYRIMNLQKELGFPLVLADLKQGWHVLDPIKASNTPVFLSMDLPEEKKKKDKKEEEETDKEKAQLKKRQEEALKQHQAQAATFEKAGVKFGFSLLSVKGKDIKSNLRTMIENGLSEDAALAALTTTPAKQLGLSKSLGTVEAGKIANLVVTDAPYFSEDSNVRYVFIDGKLFDYEVKPKKKAGNSDAKVDVAGTWSYSVKTPDQERDGTLKIVDKGGELIGTIFNSETGDSSEASDLELSGNELTFSSVVSMGSQSITLEFNLVVDGDNMEGSVNVGEFGTFDVEGSKNSTPE